jgi:hypothetical protein
MTRRWDRPRQSEWRCEGRPTLGQLGDLPEMRELLKAIFAECAAVAERLDIRFPVSLDRRLEAGLASATTTPPRCRT